MYEIKIKANFSAAHNLQEAGGECERLHGHNFTVEVAVESDVLNEQGMLMDFRILKAKTQSILDTLDHRYLNQLPIFKDKNPSSENLAAHIFAELSRQVDREAQKVSWVSVWESENSQATFRRPRK